MEEEKKRKMVELRSEEVEEVMGKIPPWIQRWGITVLFLVVAVLVAGSCFFKYPDIIVSEMTLTGRYPVAQIVARTSGRIGELHVTDGQAVTRRSTLAVIENPASTDDVFMLREMLSRYANRPDSFLIRYRAETKEFSLGEIQSVWAALLNSLHEYENYYSLGFYTKKIAATRSQIAAYQSYYQNQKRRQAALEATFKLAGQQYSRDSLLFVRNVISAAEHENAINAFLQSRYTFESSYAALENLQIQIGEQEVNLINLELQQAERENQLSQNFRNSAEQLANAINSWELNYCLSSSIDGSVAFTRYWNRNQSVSAGDNVFTVLPDRDEELIGRALLPLHRSGKVKIGQRVIVRFINFPDQEFGIVNGVVKAISPVPFENNCYLEIAFPNGLTTNYKIHLPVAHEMKASAEIVTEDLRLIERFFMPIKRMLKEGL